jgi:hypothetical protein
LKLPEDVMNLVLEFIVPEEGPLTWQPCDPTTGECFFQYECIYDAAQKQGITSHGIEENLNTFRNDKGGGCCWRCCEGTPGIFMGFDPRNGRIVYEFESIDSAMRSLNVNHRHQQRIVDRMADIKEINRLFRGCLWRFCDKSKDFTLEAYDRGRPETAVSRYESMDDAVAELGITVDGILENENRYENDNGGGLVWYFYHRRLQAEPMEPEQWIRYAQEEHAEELRALNI